MRNCVASLLESYNQHNSALSIAVGLANGLQRISFFGGFSPIKDMQPLRGCGLRERSLLVLLEHLRCSLMPLILLPVMVDNLTLHLCTYIPCTSAPLRLCTSAPLRLCASAPLRLCTSAPLRLCTSAPLYLCTSAPLHLCTSAPLHLCTSVPLGRCASTPLCPCAPVPLYR